MGGGSSNLIWTLSHFFFFLIMMAPLIFFGSEFNFLSKNVVVIADPRRTDLSNLCLAV